MTKRDHSADSGKAKPGKTKDPDCSDGGSSSSTRSDLVLSRFNKVAKVTAPRGAVTPEQAAGGSGTDAPTTPALYAMLHSIQVSA